MKISVLLPTRDRLSLLSHAVESIVRLDDPDYEIVISDNCSSGDVRGYVSSLEDSRIVYLRSDEVLSITENWNKALEGSSGDYVIMLGDDDALLSTYFTRTRQLAREYGDPQVIYHGALGYVYPGVMPGEPEGLLSSAGYARFLRGAKEACLLPVDQARQLVHDAAGFRLGYGLNMQFVSLQREFVEELRGGGSFYRSPFPDFYAMNHVFARAETIVVEPQPLVVVGVTPQSHGFFHFNNRDGEAKAFLDGSSDPENARSHRSELVPGTNMNDGWLRALEELHERLGCPSYLAPSYRRYRFLQIIQVYNAHYVEGRAGSGDVAQLGQHMKGVERLLYGLLFRCLRALRRALPASMRLRVGAVATLLARQFSWWDPVRDEARYEDISEVVASRPELGDCTRWAAQRGSRLRSRVLMRIFP